MAAEYNETNRDLANQFIIIIIKRLCWHAICQMNAIAITMQAMNHGRGKLSHDQSG